MVQAWKMGAQMHDLHPHQMLTEVILHDRLDSETFFFGQMIKKLHPLYSSLTTIAKPYLWPIPLPPEIWLMLNLNVWLYFQSFNEDLAFDWEGVCTVRAEGILPLVLFSDFDWELHIYIPLIPIALCRWVLMIRINVGDSGQKLYIQMTAGQGQMGYRESGGIRR